ncbi:MAG: terminase [Citromicrobium sp.]|nr:terminase [Citromicrobium sp.]
MGRPTKYHSSYCEIARDMAERGATNAELAEWFGVSRRTINTWTQQHPEFAEALRLGKEPADDRVERALFERAVGYEVEEDHVFIHEGKPLVVTLRQRVPPNTSAARHWLRNRRLAKGRNRAIQ